MCGRFSLAIDDYTTLAELVGVAPSAEQSARYRPRYNVAPTDEHWILRALSERRELARARWGFVGQKNRATINARAESVERLALFGSAFLRTRCVVPADGFFEWTGAGAARQPIWFHPPADAWLPLAGLFRREANGHESFTIITTTANQDVRAVHDRMPVVLAVGDIDRWLAEPARDLLAPCPDGILIATPVSRRVNSVRHDDPACLAPPSGEPQGSLFGRGSC